MNSSDIEWLQSIFKDSDLFDGISEREVSGIIDHMERMNYAPGDLVVETGRVADLFFVVQKGRVCVTRKGRFWGKKEVASLGPGEFFGEIGLMTDEKRTATLTAEEETICFSIFRNQFRDLMDQFPSFRKEIENLMQARRNSES